MREDDENDMLNYVREGRSDMIEMYLPDMDDYLLTKASGIAANKGYIWILEMLMKRGLIDYDLVATEAAKKGRSHIANYMIDVGADDISSIIAGFAYGGYRELVLVYIRRYGDADINLIAYAAAKRGHLLIVSDMVEMGANEYEYISQGAIEENRIPVLMFLLEVTDVDVFDIRDLASSYNRREMMDAINNTIVDGSLIGD
jgi:hypothetical protein